MSESEVTEISEPEPQYKISELTDEDFLASKIVDWLDEIKGKNLDDKFWLFEDVQVICNTKIFYYYFGIST